MVPFRQVDSLAAVGSLSEPLHLAVGMFDGVHLGHQAVIESAIHSAGRAGVAGVLTFNPHPSRLFRPDNPTRLLLPDWMKVDCLRRQGVALVIVHPFDHAFASVEAEDFPSHLKGFLPTLKSLYVGENFCFGKARRGDVNLLVKEARKQQINVFSAERIQYNGKAISSTRIRGHIEEGDMDEVNAMLGYPYRAEGVVEAGKRLGRKLGFPTLNLKWSPELCPRFGVYRVKIRRLDSDIWLDGVANYGLRPTVESGESEPRLEVHVLGDTELDAGDRVRVEWYRFIRGERKFASVETLREQIARDVAIARADL